MLVDHLRQEREEGWVKVSARIVWEDNDRTEERLCIHVSESLADDVECNPNAFLLATAIPAAKYGERRLAIEGQLCPVLYDGMLTVLTQLREWYDKARPTPAIEPSEGFQTRQPNTSGRAGQFFSGGVDALATLRRNRLMYPADHPSSIRDGLFVFGAHPYDYHCGERSPDRFEVWQRAWRQIRQTAAETGLDVHGITTNVFAIFDDAEFGDREFYGSGMFVLPHLFPSRFHEFHIAGSEYVADLIPWGTHPLIDPYFGSSYLRVSHDGCRLRRLEKVQLIADWPVALSTLNVCFRNKLPTDRLNCGTCPKCLRTMLELLICGRLHEATAFPANDVDPNLLRSVHLLRPTEDMFFRECQEPLARMGRHDLVAAIDYLLHDFERRRRHKAGLGLKPKIKRLDERLLGGWMQRTWKGRKKNKA